MELTVRDGGDQDRPRYHIPQTHPPKGRIGDELDKRTGTLGVDARQSAPRLADETETMEAIVGQGAKGRAGIEVKLLEIGTQ